MSKLNTLQGSIRAEQVVFSYQNNGKSSFHLAIASYG